MKALYLYWKRMESTVRANSISSGATSTSPSSITFPSSYLTQHYIWLYLSDIYYLIFISKKHFHLRILLNINTCLYLYLFKYFYIQHNNFYLFFIVSFVANYEFVIMLIHL